MKDEKVLRRRFADHQILLLSLILGFAFVVIGGCRGTDEEVVARVGSRKLTKSELLKIAEKPLDSLSQSEKWNMVQDWVNQNLVDLEAKRVGLDRDAHLKAQLSELSSELYRSKMLAGMEAKTPTDQDIEAYYKNHQSEFLRPSDAYYVELFWAEDLNDLQKFKRRWQSADSVNIKEWPEISSEGRFMAEHNELDPELEQQLMHIVPHEFTEPKPYEDGYRMVRLLDVYQAGQRVQLADVRDEILQRLMLDDSRHRQEQLMTDLKLKYKVETTKDSL